MDKLNKTFKAEQILTADEMNQITSKIDEVIDNTTTTIMDLKWTTDLATTKKSSFPLNYGRKV